MSPFEHEYLCRHGVLEWNFLYKTQNFVQWMWADMKIERKKNPYMWHREILQASLATHRVPVSWTWSSQLQPADTTAAIGCLLLLEGGCEWGAPLDPMSHKQAAGLKHCFHCIARPCFPQGQCLPKHHGAAGAAPVCLMMETPQHIAGQYMSQPRQASFLHPCIRAGKTAFSKRLTPFTPLPSPTHSSRRGL